MATSANLEDRFNAAVSTIQNLPADGIIQPSNLTKLIFYGFYKQATIGSCKEPRPSVFNYVGRAKWDAWNRCQSMTKEQAMLAYIDEIQKIVKTMPQTDEVLAFTQLIGLSSQLNEVQSGENDSAVLTIKNQQQTTITKNDHNEIPVVNSNNPTKTVDSAGNAPISSSSSSSSSSISISDLDEFYDDPSDWLVPDPNEMTASNNIPQQSIHTTRLHHSPNVSGSQNETNIPVRHSTRAHYSTSFVASGSNNGHYSTNNNSKETQRAILTALTKLQRDIHNILERLNRLETTTYLLQQRELSLSAQLNSSSQWSPLFGFRRGTKAFILLWPFVAFILIRLFHHAKIIIRFRRQHL